MFDIKQYKMEQNKTIMVVKSYDTRLGNNTCLFCNAPESRKNIFFVSNVLSITQCSN